MPLELSQKISERYEIVDDMDVWLMDFEPAHWRESLRDLEHPLGV
jgi:hypothetical protein